MSSTRQWTIEELDREHPLPGDWEWMEDGSNGGVQMWSAVVRDYDYGEPEVTSIVSVDREGRLHGEYESDDTDTADVTLAVLLVSMGRDSLEAMADEAYRQGWSHERTDIVDFITSPPGRVPEWVRGQIAELAAAIGRAGHVGWGQRLYTETVRTAAAMLRRGTVKP
jgi:hypothetical protein